jgi:hypothetical protein
MNKTRSSLHMFKKNYLITVLNLHRSFVPAESTTWIFFIFWPSKIHVSPTDIVSSISPPWCHIFFGRRRHTTALCHVYFLLSQDELASFASSSDNVLYCRLPSRAETKSLNLHHRHMLSSPYRPTPTLHCYKKIITILATLPIT